jgi:hypothetical protein
MSMLIAFVNALPYLLGAAFCLFMLYGFWRGLGLSAHTPRHRMSEGEYWHD